LAQWELAGDAVATFSNQPEHAAVWWLLRRCDLSFNIAPWRDHATFKV